MRGFSRPWFVCGGWAVDLFVGRETRAHADIEVGLLRDDQGALREHLKDWSFEKVLKGSPSRVETWEPGEFLEKPNHEAYAKKEGQVLEILLNEHEGGDWVFRREEKLRAPLSELVGYYDGIPYLNPQFVLLYKARGPREKDLLDLRIALPKMTLQSKLWLKEALRVSEGPEHDWIRTLERRP